MSYNRILPHKLVKYDVFMVTVQGVSWIRGVAWPIDSSDIDHQQDEGRARAV